VVDEAAAAAAAEVVVVVVEEAVHVAGHVAVHGEGGLEVGPLGVLPLPLVRVLVPAQRLRRREVAAAVVALELPLGGRSGRGRRSRAAALGAAVALGRDRAAVGVVGGVGRGVLLLLGLPLLVVGEVAAEQPDGGVPRLRRRRGRPDERQLREGVDAAHLLRLRHGRLRASPQEEF